MAKAFTARQRTNARLFNTGVELGRAAFNSGELAAASAVTIMARTRMMAAALGDPVAMTSPEFTLMGTEKINAAMESGRVIAASLGDISSVWLSWAVGQVQIATRAWIELATARSLSQAVAAQGRYFHHSWEATSAAAARLGHDSVRAASAGMRPVHRVAAANAARLSRRRG